jgi:hypothetical protein
MAASASLCIFLLLFSAGSAGCRQDRSCSRLDAFIGPDFPLYARARHRFQRGLLGLINPSAYDIRERVILTMSEVSK